LAGMPSARVTFSIRRFSKRWPQTSARAAPKPSRRSASNSLRPTHMKICALLVPREMKVEHSAAVKAMSDEQLEQGIEAIAAMLAAKDAGANAKVIEGKVEPVPGPPKAQRKRRKTDADVVEDVGSDADGANS
jgi:hypothetical protein